MSHHHHHHHHHDNHHGSGHHGHHGSGHHGHGSHSSSTVSFGFGGAHIDIDIGKGGHHHGHHHGHHDHHHHHHHGHHDKVEVILPTPVIATPPAVFTPSFPSPPVIGAPYVSPPSTYGPPPVSIGVGFNPSPVGYPNPAASYPGTGSGIGFNPGASYPPAVSIPVYSPPGGGRVLIPIHRFYHPSHQDHFYSTNISEGTPHGYSSEGVGFQLSSTPAPGLVPVYRYWRVDVKDHFYTTNVSEIGTVTPGSTGKLGYICEGVLGYISPVSMPGTVPVYRYWKESVQDHFYTTNASEIGAVVSGSSGNHGYLCEGVLGYSFV